MRQTQFFGKNLKSLILMRVLAIELSSIMVFGCAPTSRLITIEIPPRMDLKGYSLIGIIDFSSNADSSVERYAAQQLQEHIQAAQPGVPFIELGPLDTVLAEVEAKRLDANAIKRIGEKYGVEAVFSGDILYSEPKTDFDLSQILDFKAKARTYIDATLTVRLSTAQHGATIWSNSSNFQRTLTDIKVIGKKMPVVDVQGRESPQHQLIPDMIHAVICDFRPTYEKQRVKIE